MANEGATIVSPLIRIEKLAKSFFTDKVETHAISNVSFTISKGEYVAISGPSGCGKSTLLSIIGLIEDPTEGRYHLNGREVASLNFRERSRIRNQEIGFIFQSFNLISDLTVCENIELPLKFRRNMPYAVRKRRVSECLERIGMEDCARRFPTQLSGGQQQRVAVARALAGSPSIVLADEPTGNLDSRSGEAVMKLLADLHGEGATICIVTHDSRFVTYAERKICLFDGRIMCEAGL